MGDLVYQHIPFAFFILSKWLKPLNLWFMSFKTPFSILIFHAGRYRRKTQKFTFILKK